MEAEEIKSNPADKTWKYGSRMAELFVGLTTTAISNFLFDYLLYPYVIYTFGIIKGGLVMTFLSLAACLLILKFYDWLKKDWLGIEAIKEFKDYKGEKKLGKLTAWAMKKSNLIIFIFLSVRYDPFITTVYMRNGKYNGMSKRDWTIFMSSLILANAYWVLACLTGITLFEWVWKAVVG